jgi:hypothetical protein
MVMRASFSCGRSRWNGFVRRKKMSWSGNSRKPGQTSGTERSGNWKKHAAKTGRSKKKEKKSQSFWTMAPTWGTRKWTGTRIRSRSAGANRFHHGWARESVRIGRESFEKDFGCWKTVSILGAGSLRRTGIAPSSG